MVRVLGVLAVLTCMGIAASPMVCGQLASAGYRDFVRGVERGADGKLRLQTTSYNRGYLESTAVTRVTTLEGPKASFVVEHRIQHGPVGPDGSVFLTRMRSEVWPEDPKERQALETPLANLRVDSPLVVGKSRLELESAAFRAPDGTLVWNGIEAWLEVERRTGLGRGELAFHGLEIREPDGSRLDFEPVAGSAHFDFSDDESPLRGFDVRLERIAVRELGKPPAEFGPLAVTNEITQQGELVGHRLTLELEQMTVEGMTFGPIVLEVESRNLDPEGVAALRRLRDEQDPVKGPDVASLQEVLADMAPHSPTVEMKRFEVDGPYGTLELSGRIHLDGQRFAAAGGESVMPALSASAELAVSERFLNQALESSLKKAAEKVALPRLPVREMIQALLRAGYVDRQGDRLHSRIEHLGTALKLNDKIFSPEVLMAELATEPRSGAAPRPDALPKRARDGQEFRTVVPASPNDDAELEEMRRQLGLGSR